MSGGDYLKLRRENSDVSAQIRINTTGASGTLASGVASGSIFVQKLIVVPTTTGAVTWTANDGTGAITPPISMTGSGYAQDFGSRGIQISTGTALTVSLSATGAAGLVEFEGYWKYTGGTSVGVFPASGASGTTP